MEEDKECDGCHGEPPDIRRPTSKLCVLCHDDEYADLLGTWSKRTDELTARLTAAVAAGVTKGADPEAIDRGRRALRLVRRDGSHGAHNFGLLEGALFEAFQELE